MKEMIKNAAILFLITLISGALLGIVYDVTKEPIQQQKEKAKQEAYKEVFASAESFESVSVDGSGIGTKLKAAGLDADLNEVVAAKDANGVLGYVITVTDHEGYGGDIQFAVGIMMDGTMNGISILSISETAGLGMRADEVLKPQFVNKKVNQFSYTKSGSTSDDQIDAISGATITTNAVVNGVNAALKVMQEELNLNGSNE